MKQKLDKLLSTFGFILKLVFVATPKDLWGWVTTKRKCVHGKTIVITGGGSGIQGCNCHNISITLGKTSTPFVTTNRIHVNKAKTVAASIIEKEIVGKVQALRCDVSDEKSLASCAKEIYSCFGSVDIVICNAAVLYFGHTLELETASLERAFDVNVMGTLNTIRAFLPDMEAKNSGQIVTISSVAGHFGETFGMAYCPAKFAVRGIMEVLEMELYDRGLNGIVCTTICPWFVRTPMILNVGMRPTSRWISFMSINRCANQIVDAVLKEKTISYVPFIIRVMVMLKPLLPKRVQLEFRSYLNCRYEPTECQISNEKIELSNEEQTNTSLSTLGNMGDYFKLPNFFWFIIIPFGLLLTFLVWKDPDLFNTPALSVIGKFLYHLGTNYSVVILWINILAWALHVFEAVYALYICDSIGFSQACSFKWFIQTFCLGFPSLSILIYHRKKISK